MTRYLGSTKNLVGCVGGLVGVVLHLTGVVGPWWPLVVAALYAAGALVAPPEKVRLVPVDAATEAGQVREGLATLVGEVAGQASRMPESTVDAVRRIADVLGDMLSRPARLAANPDLRHTLVRLARTDLPLSVQTYLNLPWWFAVKRRTGGEPSAGEELVTQLGLLERQAHQLAERFYAGDVNQQADHTRYLRDQGE
ncbi:hypothetical protein ABZ816_05020 [Actinosynnema sp. NPDC047251]|uniref:Putative membrane protein n=1 Tax=Saccharothrix espanaensis (strain ATCC 51144 / DSM 44229 / JCM 9112 / NBRC 15066 / NRRL 15764) TaxID=1179773 RepID=K0JUW5_SACES|nr:hypothetical protein [Saccharothrix espanaensis]CCH31625.1 putative membrane protein [Saccharothrix espanaensis DSM 44229]